MLDSNYVLKPYCSFQNWQWDGKLFTDLDLGVLVLDICDLTVSDIVLVLASWLVDAF